MRQSSHARHAANLTRIYSFTPRVFLKLARMDVTTADFEQKVINESHTRPVLVDFWAPWCGPCKVLTPTLEALEAEYEGKFVLAKVNTDAEPALGQTFQIRSIPDVKLFKAGKIVAGFVGAQGAPAIRAILDEHLPSAEFEALLASAATKPADALLALQQSGLKGQRHDDAAWAILRGALQAAPADISLIRSVAAKIPEFGSPYSERRGALLTYLEAGITPETLRALVESNADSATQYLESLLEKIEATKNHATEKNLMIAAFHLLGNENPLTLDFRRRLSRALY